MDRPVEQLGKNNSDKLKMYVNSLQFFDNDIDDYIYIYDLATGRVYFTDKFRKKFPIPPSGYNGNAVSDWNNIVYPKDYKFVDYHSKLLVNGKIDSLNLDYRIIDRQGNKVWVNVKGTLRQNKNGKPVLLVGRVSEMMFGRLVDRLTGLCNTEKFMDDMKRDLKKNDGYLMIIGVDNFKNINIVQGRAFGNDILKKAADALDENSEYPMSIYRLDGDCFAVLFPNKKRRDVVEFYNSISNSMNGSCTVSAGVVSYKSSDKTDGDAIYQYAESALDQAKREGKNRMVFFSSDNYQRSLEQIELLDEIEVAIQKDCKGFFLCYQPQINSNNFDIYGVEALLRYDSPLRGKMSPDEFIPLLEKSGLICDVGKWVLKTAVYQCKEWRKQIPNFHISVNISHVQLKKERFVDTVLNIINDIGLPGEALTLEVTESIQLQDYSYFNKIFYTLKQYGIKIAIDDFGTGYSSLSYLKSIEIDEVKIDRCFIDHIQNNAYNYRLLSNMIELTHSANISACCEGVETFDELMALQELHTDIYQGYLFAKPYTKEEFEKYYICPEAKEYQDRKAREYKFRKMEPSDSKGLLDGLRKEEISNIVEGMEEMVYVSDVDTYELYYLNAAGRNMTGVYDYKGCKCYEVLQGKDKPCDFCTNKKLREDKFYVWESKNTFLKRNYILKDKLIPWQGKIARLEMAIDITHKEIVSQAIQKKMDFEKTIVKACKLIASESDSVKSSYGIIKIMGEFCKADRAYILKQNKVTDLWNISWEWCAKGVDSVKKSFPKELEQITKQNNENVIAVPIMRKDRLIGYVCVDNPRYIDDGRDLVKTMAYFLGYSMIGQETNNTY